VPLVWKLRDLCDDHGKKQSQDVMERSMLDEWSMALSHKLNDVGNPYQIFGMSNPKAKEDFIGKLCVHSFNIISIQLCDSLNSQKRDALEES
jgi:hypothetical protein